MYMKKGRKRRKNYYCTLPSSNALMFTHLNDSAVGRIKGPGGFGTLHHAAKISVGNDVPDRVLDGRLRSPLAKKLWITSTF